MGLEEFRGFLQVVDEGSFAAAATALGVSRTTLRRQVDALEAEAGVALLERTAKGVVLTEAGRRLVVGGRQMEQDFRALMRGARGNDGPPEGEIRVMLPTGLLPAAVAMIFGMIRTNWPGVRVRAAFTDRIEEVQAATTDVACWFGETAPSGSWETRTFATSTQRLLASREYLAAHGTPETFEDLKKHTVFAWLSPGEAEPMLATDQGLVPLAATAIANHPHIIHECVHQGVCIGWVPQADFPMAPGIEAPVRLFEARVGRPVPLRLGVPRALARTPKVKIFLDHLDMMRALILPAQV